MRLLLPIALLILALPAWAAPRHDVTVTLDPAARSLTVLDVLTVGGGRVELAPAPGLAITRLEVDGERRAPADSLTLAPGPHRLVVGYGGTLAALGEGEPAAGPEGAFLPAGSGWLPRTAERAAWRLAVTVPPPHRAVADGRLVGENVFEQTHAGDPPSLFAGPWQVTERPGRLRAYLHADNAGLADDYLAVAAGHLAHFSQLIGAHPFDGFAIVSAPLPVGLGFQGLTWIGRTVLPRPFVRDRSLAHEILHDWWGNGVFVDRASGNWAEGLTTLLADHDLSGGPAAAAMRLAWLRDFAALPAGRDAPLAAFVAKEHDAAQVVGYGKAAMVFHMLRDRLGAETFRQGLALFWRRHRFQEAGWSDLRRAFEAASGADLSVFFGQWLTRSGAPAPCLETAAPVPGGVRIVLTQAEPFWDLAVPVEVGGRRHLVALTGARAEAVLPTAAPSPTVALDPRHDLFRRLAPGEAPPILRDVTLDLEAAVLAEGEAARDLAIRLMDGAPRFADGATARPPLAVIGTGPGVETALARLGLAVPAQLAGRGTARAWVARTPEGPVLAVQADDDQALRALLRPLPHYGGQGWLVFEGAKAADRGQWPAGNGAVGNSCGAPP